VQLAKSAVAQYNEQYQSIKGVKYAIGAASKSNVAEIIGLQTIP